MARKKNGNGGKELALVEKGDYAMMSAEDDVRAALNENMGGQAISPFDLDRMKVPAGGATNWAVPNLDGSEDAAKEIGGVIVCRQDKRVYWASALDESGGGTPPDCFSDDLERGIGKPGGQCTECPNAQFKTARGGEGAGQACKQMVLLFILRADQLLPMALTIPPSSLKNARKYLLGLASKGIAYRTIETFFGLEKAQSGGGIAYSRITFRAGRRLGEEAQKLVKEYADDFSDAFKATNLSAEDLPTDEG